MQPLNYVPKALAQLLELAETALPLSRQGFTYLAGKLRVAQAFLLPDHGQLLDRDKVRPEVPGLVFRPAFPVVALEYQSPPQTARITPGYTDMASSKRIALAWEWENDLPPGLQGLTPHLGPGVAIASIFYCDSLAEWMPVSAAYHLPYDAAWEPMPAESNPFREAMIESGQISRKVAAAPTTRGTVIPLLPEPLMEVQAGYGQAALMNSLTADLMDEVNAYTDLCYALACRNVQSQLRPAPKHLNKQRLKAGKLPLLGYHILTLAGDEATPLASVAPSARGASRSHLRRGHIRHLRHLGPDRVTWVNSTMVKGRAPGFAAKAYAVPRIAA